MYVKTVSAPAFAALIARRSASARCHRRWARRPCCAWEPELRRV